MTWHLKPRPTELLGEWAREKPSLGYNCYHEDVEQQFTVFPQGPSANLGNYRTFLAYPAFVEVALFQMSTRPTSE
jgi:hypothetical protein